MQEIDVDLVTETPSPDGVFYGRTEYSLWEITRHALSFIVAMDVDPNTHNQLSKRLCWWHQDGFGLRAIDPFTTFAKRLE